MIDQVGYYARHSADERPVRLVLDTNVASGLITGLGPQLDWKAVSVRKREILVSLSDAAFVQLLMAIHCGHIEWSMWERSRQYLLKIIDPYLPVMPGRGDALGVFGFSDFTPDKRLSVLKEYQSYGSFLLTVKSYDQLRGLLKEQEMRDLFKQERDDWASIFRDPARFKGMPGVGEADVVKVAAYIQENVRLERTPWNDMFLKIVAHYLIAAAKGKDAYNPQSKKRKDDFVDQTLCFALPLPAIVVSADRKFRTAIMASGTIWSRQLIAVEEANDRVALGTLRQLLPDA